MRAHARRAVLLGLAIAVYGPIGGADARPILETAFAEEVAAQLAEATAVQGICYGWQVQIDDDDGTDSGTEVGSSRGAGLAAEHPSCPRFMVFRAELHYTSESSESSDSARFYVWANVGGGPDEEDLRRVGVSGEALLGNNDDLAIANAVLALPALVAEHGLAPPVPAVSTEGTIPAADRPTGRPGSDWIRAYGVFAFLSAALVIGGLGWAGWAWAADRFGLGKHSVPE
ncbi:MAG TPA: hypothetical protein VGV86_07355 [Acidimicrobiales bacterium]|nr:hypothetical protein [Acidimicrobiales bacterium]